jgi:Zn-dependent M32 family carboxypeptidase
MLQEAFDDYDDLFGRTSLWCSQLRVEADELTYLLHVILRYNIERHVVEGKLEVKDIPERWNKGGKGTVGYRRAFGRRQVMVARCPWSAPLLDTFPPIWYRCSSSSHNWIITVEEIFPT